MIGMAVVWILLIVAAVVLIRWLVSSNRTGGRPSDSAEEILRQRYARGEIDRSEYERTLTDLRR